MNAEGQRRYSTGAMWFHWIIAILVIVSWRVVVTAQGLEGPDKGWWMDHHKALGVTILVLTIARLIWRLTHPVPGKASTTPAWQHMLARTLHVLFYVMLIGLPIGGWLASSYFGGSIDMWGAFTVPGLPVGESREMGKTIIGFHKTGGEALVYLVGLHILGALKHMLIDKDGNLWRMLPWGTPKA
ncbi:cytochrome b [Pontixanthobacter aestiaquae]|uniref:Cytochrome b n=1 Tax=Pontixanthobacter aestiaquae TaxID=1509367 RepID=A0A844Z6T3_9SPHN|nr:cytochrome b [Pontixanthobacter aestiaquae]MDN3645792.1 cytochrome b [Pontixanthobacter aestiaquae]MXO83214.1 cytochrome b [Pontixanthobacter aestiaquae]